MNEEMTMREALDMTRDELNGVLARAVLADGEVGAAVARSVMNLTACIEAIDRENKEEKKDG